MRVACEAGLLNSNLLFMRKGRGGDTRYISSEEFTIGFIDLAQASNDPSKIWGDTAYIKKCLFCGLRSPNQTVITM